MTEEHNEEPTNKEMTKIINDTFSKDFCIETDNDQDFLRNGNYSWDDLITLKQDIGNNILDFIGQVNSIIMNNSIVSNLGSHKSHFNKLVALFYSDINEFSKTVKELSSEHEGKSGSIVDINDYNNYNRLAIQYHAAFTELATLISPTLSEIVILVNDISVEYEKNHKTQEKPEAV
jgi:hypothetical protein